MRRKRARGLCDLLATLRHFVDPGKSQAAESDCEDAVEYVVLHLEREHVEQRSCEAASDADRHEHVELCTPAFSQDEQRDRCTDV